MLLRMKYSAVCVSLLPFFFAGIWGRERGSWRKGKGGWLGYLLGERLFRDMLGLGPGGER